MNPFTQVWSAMKRLAESFNRLADGVDSMSEQIEARQQPDEPRPLIDLHGEDNGKTRRLPARK